MLTNIFLLYEPAFQTRFRHFRADIVCGISSEIENRSRLHAVELPGGEGVDAVGFEGDGGFAGGDLGAALEAVGEGDVVPILVEAGA